MKKLKSLVFISKDDIMQNHEQEQELKKEKKSENPRFYGQKKPLFWQPTLQPLGNFSHMATYRSFSKE
jgi:hypothetical protein